MKRNYPVGIKNFEEIRKRNYCYVDKTALIFRMVTSGKYYFLSRPRGFGKSLLISTLEAYFQGKRELFEGLAIEKLETDWTEYPILHLDLNTKTYKDCDSLNEILGQHLEKWEAIYGDEKKDRSPEERFTYIIEKTSKTTGRNVVILIDEYDKPMRQTISNEELLTESLNTMKAFCGALKSCDRYIKFAMLTGMTRFHVLNNLMDISMSDRFADLCGISEDELYRDFKDEIIELGQKNEMTEADTKAALKGMYGGYHFVEDSADIYNPFSILNTFSEMKFGSYWPETGTPTFLVEILKRNRYDLHRLTQEMASADSLAGIGPIFSDPVSILYQSGYLTIKGYDKEFKVYYLGFPNKEVEEGFTKFILP